MKRLLYNIIIPKSIRESIYAANVQEFRAQTLAQAQLQADLTSHADLSPIYIANLKVVNNRNDLLSKMPMNAVCAEIGVGKGDFANRILAITKPQVLHLLDSWMDEMDSEQIMKIVNTKFKCEIGLSQVVIHKGTPIIELKRFDDGYFDWVYLDTQPSYENIASMLELCKTKVKTTGIIAGHNYIGNSWLENINNGVIKAVNEFCKRHGWEMIFLTHESHRRLSYAIKKITP